VIGWDFNNYINIVGKVFTRWYVVVAHVDNSVRLRD